MSFNSWKKVYLSQIASYSQGKQVPIKEQFEQKECDNNRFLRIVDYTNENEPARYVKNYGDRYFVKKDDLIMIRYGSKTAGKVVRGYSGIIANNMFKLNFDDTVDLNYMYYRLSSDEIYKILNGSQSSSTMPAITFGMLNNIEILLPPLSEQKAIANTLLCLENKIKINNRINKTLEKTAQAIFKSWFVDFEPFQDGEFEDSELGRIPKGWKVKLLGGEVKISTKSINPKNETGVIFEHYSIPAFDEGKMPVFESAIGIKSNKYIVTNTCFLVSKLNPSTKRIWKPLCLTKDAICSTEFMVYEAINPKHTDFYYSLINHDIFTDFLISNSTGSTNSRQRVKPSTTLNYQYVCPTEDEIVRFVGVVQPIYCKINKNIIENQRLAEIRTALLPKLMSGEIQVPFEEVQ